MAEALGQDLAVAPVAAEDVVLHAEEERLAHGRSLLADGKVRGPLMDVRDVAVLAQALDLVQHRLELADETHVAVDPDRVVFRQRPCRQLVGEAAAVLVDGDGAEGDRFLLPDLVGGDDELLDHGR